MTSSEIISQIRDQILEGDLEVLEGKDYPLHPSEWAEVMEELPKDLKIVCFQSFEPDLQTEVFPYLEHNDQIYLISRLKNKELRNILNAIDPDDRTGLFEELSGVQVTRLLNLLSPAEKTKAQTLLGYEENSIGRLMTPDFIALHHDMKVSEAFKYIRLHGEDNEVLNVIYVIDVEGKLVDDIPARRLLIAPPEILVSELMDGSFEKLFVHDDKELAIQAFKQYDRVALPVVDENNLLLGVVTVDDVLDTIEDEDTEDIQKFGGLEALDYPYKDTPILHLVRKRAGWLVLLFIGEMLTATAMGFFQDEIAKAVILALFVPLIISSGGNSGSQAATLIIRSLALDELDLEDWVYVLKRELISGLLLGSILGAIGFARIAFWTLFTNIYGPHWFMVALTVSFTLVGVVMWGTLSGSMLPFLLKKLKFDPATSSAPFVATLVDVTGLVIYFSVAALLLRGIML